MYKDRFKLILLIALLCLGNCQGRIFKKKNGKTEEKQVGKKIQVNDVKAKTHSKTGKKKKDKSSSSIEILTKASYLEITQKTPYTLVMYFHRRDQLSRKVESKLEHLDVRMKNIKFAKMDGGKYPAFADEMGIKEFPTFEMFVYGVPIRYDQPLTMSSLRKWMSKISKLEPKNAQELTDLSSKDYEVYYMSKDGSDLDKIMLGCSKKYQDINIFKVTKSLTEKLLKKYSIDAKNLEKDDLLFVRRKHDEHTKIYDGKETAFDIEKWLVDQEYPDFSQLNEMSIQWLETEKLPILFFFFDSKKVDSKWVEAFKATGSKIKATALSVLSDINQTDVKKFAEENGILKIPSLVIMEHDKLRRRFMCQSKALKKVTDKIIDKCITRYEGGRLSRFYKSEDPKKLDKTLKNENWKYLTGMDFNRIYENYKTYSLVYFYNSNHTSDVITFQRVAESFNNVKKLSFSIFNMDKNENEEVEGVKPGTLMLFTPRAMKVPKITPESLTPTIIMEFLEDHTPSHLYKTVLEARKDVLDGIDL